MLAKSIVHLPAGSLSAESVKSSALTLFEPCPAKVAPNPVELAHPAVGSAFPQGATVAVQKQPGDPSAAATMTEEKGEVSGRGVVLPGISAVWVAVNRSPAAMLAGIEKAP